MEDGPLKVLLVEDNPGDARLIREMLAEASGEAFRLEHVERLQEATARLAADGVDIVLLDLSLPDTTGLETVRRALEKAGDVPLVVLTGLPDEAQARQAVHEGAQDYLVKGQVNGDLLRRSLRYAVERGRVEAELRRRAEALAEADRRKDEFLAMLSHELRAPLAPLLSAAEVMRAGGPLPDPQLEWAREMVARQVTHMAGLLEDLLDLSRITVGKIRIRKEPIRLEEVVERALSTTRGRIDARGQRLSVSTPSESVWLNADPDRIEQVLVNLLRNASAYTDPGGAIQVSAEAEGDSAVVRVQDDGIGMDAETLERIFEPFAQGPGSAERSEGGLGVGLSLTRALVELHGGSIRAHSPGPGRGSEFLVLLPRMRAAPGPDGEDHRPAAARPGADGPEGVTVLVVDDNRDAAEGLRILLSAWGCEVRVAHDGSEALEVARGWTPEIVLLDIGLPGLDGYAVAEALRENARTADIRIVAVSGYGKERDRSRAQEAGFDDYLVKPVQPPDIRALLARGRSAGGPSDELAAAEGSGEPVAGSARTSARSASGRPSERERP